MRAEHLEAWVLSIVDLVTAGQRVEDSRVELKSEWPNPETAARRVAGHANASRGSQVLWIVGLNEQRGVVPFKPVEPASWFAQFEKAFDGLAPSADLLLVPSGGGAVCAVLFDTLRRPFVVKNPSHGQPNAGPISLKVPWRDGTRTRSARREDLIRLLVPALPLPTFEVLEARATADPSAASTDGQQTPKLVWSVFVELYITTRTTDRIVLPMHHAVLELRTPAQPPLAMQNIQITPPYWISEISRVDSHTITATSGEVIITGPGKLHVRGSFEEPQIPLLAHPPDAEIRLQLMAAGDDRPMDVFAHLIGIPPLRNLDGTVKSWEWSLTGQRLKE